MVMRHHSSPRAARLYASRHDLSRSSQRAQCALERAGPSAASTRRRPTTLIVDGMVPLPQLLRRL